MCNNISLQVADLQKFKDNIRNGNCPFCGEKLKWYDGCLGYEANRCYGCNFTIDHFGMHLNDLPGKRK